MEKQVGHMSIGRAYLRSGNILWDTAVMDFLADVLSQREESTERYYAAQLSLLARWSVGAGIDLREFAVRHMRLYLVKRGESVSDMTRRHDAVCAKVFFAFASREGYVDKNPLLDYRIKKAPASYVKCPSADELRLLLDSLVKRWNPAFNPGCRNIPPHRRAFFRHRNLAIVAGLIETGCRAGELLGLHLEDYHAQAREIAIRTSKTNEPRIVPVTNNWVSLVSSWLAVRPKKIECQHLFVGEYGLPIDVSDFGHLFKRQIAYAGLEGFSLHSLRHYAASELARNDFWAAMAILGHANPASTRKYLHPQSEQMRNAQDQVNTLGNLLVNKSTTRSHRRRVI